MGLIELKTFMLLMETGSVTTTAQNLNRVPSAITTRLHQLENYLGVELFLREKKRLVATPKALEFYQYACQITELMEEAENSVRNKQFGGKFRLGALESVAASRLPSALAYLHYNYPQVNLDLKTGIRENLYNLLLDNELDAILIADSPNNESLEKSIAFKEELIIIAPKDHLPIVSPNDIQSSTILVFNSGCSYRDRLLDWYHSFNQAPKRISEVTSYHTILAAVTAGIGIGIVPRILFDQFYNKDLLSIHPIAQPFSYVEIELIWRKKLYSANIEIFNEILAREFVDTFI